jgi:hypothetical protein
MLSNQIVVIRLNKLNDISYIAASMFSVFYNIFKVLSRVNGIGDT